MSEVSLCAGHQEVSERFRKPAYHATALRSRRGLPSCVTLHGRANPHPQPSPASDEARRRMHLRRQQGLAGRLRPELGEDGLQSLYSRRKRVAIIINDVAQQPDLRGRFFISQIGGHARQTGRFTKGHQPGVGNGGMRGVLAPHGHSKGERDAGKR